MSETNPNPELTSEDLDELVMRVGHLINMINTPVTCRDVFVMMAATVDEPEIGISTQERETIIKHLGLEDAARGVLADALQDEGEGHRTFTRSEVFIQLANSVPNPLQAVSHFDAEILANRQLHGQMESVFQKYLLRG